MAEAIASAQAGKAHYNDRFDSGRQVASEMERLQPRGDLPPVPALVPGGDPDLWRHPAPIVKADSAKQVVSEKLQGVDASCIAQQREEHPEWDWD